jgi:hypothetical protein
VSTLSPDAVRSLLSGVSSRPGGEGSIGAPKRKRPYVVVYDRCARCRERHPGLCPIRVPGARTKVEYVCEWCRRDFESETGTATDS